MNLETVYLQFAIDEEPEEVRIERGKGTPEKTADVDAGPFSPPAVTVFTLDGFNERQDKRLLGIDRVFRNRDTRCLTAQFHPG